MIKIITAPEYPEIPDSAIKIFLAGGITNCPEWQQELITLFKNFFETDKEVYIFNPRRENFPIDDPSAASEQITWEFKMLEICDIFTMLFCDADSDQPICFYELGRNIERIKTRFPEDWQDRIVISTDENFKRSEDVIIQTDLATDSEIQANVTDTEDLVEEHFNSIVEKIKQLI